ncbi:MAG: lytic murein transglycosylase B [Gammaproteobacteria bacterium]|nr:lytic murein transglycosylase B [Gammaproteobacteria bacterium]
MVRKTLLPSFLVLMFPLAGLAGHYASHPEAQAFAREMAAEEDGFDEAGILSILGQAEYQQSVIDSISRPAEKELAWAKYQDIFLTEERTRSGVKFMAEHEAALQEAQKVYGVPPVIVTAIIGVETLYGKFTGDYRVVDALATLCFDYPPRAKLFCGQLKAFIRLVREEGKPITSLKGSYAGAMGLGQFIPSSYLNYAVDFDGDGFRDIWNNPTDAIGSVANYLAEHDWQRGGGIALQAEAGEAPPDVFNVSLKPSKTIAELEALGVAAPPEDLDRQQRVTPIRLTGKQGDEFWLGLKNFYVITRYNHSELYAMAVYQLSEGLRKAADSI